MAKAKKDSQSKKAHVAKKNDRKAKKNVRSTEKNARRDDLLLDPDKIQAPKLPKMPLKPPKHVGRSVKNAETVLDRIERRLKLAWFFRKELDSVLPGERDFHARAWTAWNELKAFQKKTSGGVPVATKTEAHEGLVVAVRIMRGIVEDTSRPGDAARKALRFDVALKAGSTLAEAVPDMLKGARKVRKQFPAMSDRVLGRVEEALAEVNVADVVVATDKDKKTALRAAKGDDAQLALDVLLDSMDHLRAAARSTFLPERPIAAGYFIDVLEPAGGGQAADNEPKDETPTEN